MTSSTSTGTTTSTGISNLKKFDSLGTPLSQNATKVLLCGSGELGKEVALELQRFGVEVIAVDRYENAPAMQVAHRSYVISMLDGDALRRVIETERPDYIVPEIEAISTDTLVELEAEGYQVIPSAKATRLTMNREGIRRLAAEELGITTSPFAFASSLEEFKLAFETIGYPAVVKPIMSSSGKGQSVVKSELDIEKAWHYAQDNGRAGKGRVIVEGFIDFDYEITLLTVRTQDDCLYCDPIGHTQIDGDYRTSWQPQPMTDIALSKAQEIAEAVTHALGGRGIFGVELFVKGDEVIFSEVSPRPHDTGLVTLISQNLSEFALHARALLGLPVPKIVQRGPAASSVILVEGNSSLIRFKNIDQALAVEGTDLKLFGKPEINGRRRMGVALATGNSIEDALQKAQNASSSVQVELD